MFRKFAFILFPLLLSSCVTMTTFNTQVLEPATHPVVPELRSFVLINRTITVSNDDSILPGTSSDADDNSIINRTTTDLIFSLADFLNESPGVEYIDSSRLLEIIRYDISAKPEPLLPDMVNSICDSLQSRAIISLESYNKEFSDKIVIVNKQKKPNEPQEYMMEARLNSTSFWRIYSKGGIVDEFFLNDTMTWTHNTFSRVELNKVFLPSLEEAMSQTGVKTARNFARRITPTWVDQERFYYRSGNYLMRTGAYHLINNQLDDAEKAYLELLSRDKRNLVAAAIYNIALINELRGNLTQAHVWARRSYLIYRKDATANYIEILEDLIENTGILESQLGGT